jgi:2',3'-cyclic-nucleotide 2'-phosphodiesterase (5'-nucleotidase family)
VTNALVGRDKKSLKPIVDDQEYDVAVLSFMVKGGDGYKMIPDNLIEHKNTGYLDNDVIVSYLRENSPLSLPEAGRIILAGSTTTSGTKSDTFFHSCTVLPLAIVGLLLLIVH